MSVKAISSGFCPGEVSLVLALSNPIAPGASAGIIVSDASQLPASMHLASVLVREHGFEEEVVIPTRAEVGRYFGEQPNTVYVLAVQSGSEDCSPLNETFAIGAAFTYSEIDLVNAGSGGAAKTSWSAAAAGSWLAVIGLVLLAGAHVVRRSNRPRRG